MATCFVVMGFKEKTDYQSNPQRVLNLDKSYTSIIKPAVIAAGLECVRADEIMHSGVIDRPMYEQLLEADLVIADLSTSNSNAIYELGVRHALKPYRTIVMAEKQFKFVFDINHISIRTYEHLGKEIGYEEALSQQKSLTALILSVMAQNNIDSPVFEFLPHLRPLDAVSKGAPAVKKDDKSLAELLETFESFKKTSNWAAAIVILQRLQNLQPGDPFILQQLALATYKSEQPDALTALIKAKGVLEELKPDTSVDAETVGIWGAIHKRLWNSAKNRSDLDRATRSYGRGYFIKDDYYNGINFAFLLNVRASVSTGDEAIADRVMARRVREEVLALCDTAIQAMPQKDLKPEQKADELFWINATRVEALFGAGRVDESEALRSKLVASPDAVAWKIETMNGQLTALKALSPL